MSEWDRDCSRAGWPDGAVECNNWQDLLDSPVLSVWRILIRALATELIFLLLSGRNVLCQVRQMKRNSVTQLRTNFNKCRYFVVNICNRRAWSVTGSQFDIYSRIKYLHIPSKTSDLERFGVESQNNKYSSVANCCFWFSTDILATIEGSEKNSVYV